MRKQSILLVMTLAGSLMLSSCGGGGGDAPAPAPSPGPGAGDRIAAPEPGGTAPATYTIKGNVTIAESTTLDSDTNDPQQPGYLGNDTPTDAQLVTNPTLIVGHMGKKGEGPTGPNYDFGDTEDYFKVSLQAGQVLELEFSANPSTIDLDLFLFPVAGGASVGSSVGVNKYECLRVTRSGDYYINVSMYQPTSTGGTVYQLRINAPGTTDSGATSCPNSSTSTVIPGELIAQATEATARTAASGLGSKAVTPDGIALVQGEVQVGRPVLLGMPADSATLARTMSTLAEKSSRGTLARAGLSSNDIAAKSAGELQTSYSMLARTDMAPEDRRIIETIAMSKLLQASGDYDYVEPNRSVNTYQVALTGTYPPSDRDYARQRWHYELINVPSAMAALNGLSPAPTVRPIVAVLDTGVFLSHPDLSSQLVAGFDFVPAADSGDGNAFDSNPDDTARASTSPSFHGTHVSGTVAAQGFNGTGGLGVAPMAQIMPVRVLGERGGSNYAVIQGIRFAAGLSNDGGAIPARRADVINMSLGSQGACATSMRDAVAAARAAGTIVVAASGNDSTPTSLQPIGSPANCSGVISVGAVGPNKTRSQFSNGGAGLWVAAPGGDFTNITGNPGGDGIYSTLAEYRNGARAATYGNMSGTSMASPHVAGVMALMRWANPAITVAQVDSLIANFTIVDDIGAAGRDQLYGLGLINARKSVDAALAARGAAPSPSGRVEAQPSNLSLGALRTEADLVVDRIGTSSETVTAITTSTAAISVVAKTASSVNATTKLGTYLVRANRAAIPVGSTVFPDVVITTSAGRTVRVPVTVENRPVTAVNGNLGPIYLLVYDAKAADDADAIAQGFVASPVNGVYSYTITVTAPSGTANPTAVYVYAGADLDNDGLICGGGEACGAYPVLSGVPQTLYPRGDLNNIDFSVTPFGGINAASLGVGNAGQTGRPKLLRILPGQLPVSKGN